MVNEVAELLRRETDAVAVVEARLRAIELLAAAGEQRFIAVALDELDAASDRLASLELSRVVVLASAGLDVEVGAPELPGLLGDDTGSLQAALDALVQAVDQLGSARERARVTVAAGHEHLARRLEESQALTV